MKKNTGNDKHTDQKIMDAAIPLFAKRGFAGVSVKELAQAAGVNIALISYYFGGKENLYKKILTIQFQLLAEVVVKVNDKQYSPVGRIKLFVQEMIMLHKRNPDMENLIYGEIVNPTECYDSIVKKGFDDVHHFLEGCIQEAIALGLFYEDVKADCASISLIAIIDFYLFSSHVANQFLAECEDKMEYYISEVLKNYFRGVMKPGQ